MQQYLCPIDNIPLVDSRTAAEPSLRCETCQGAWVSMEALERMEDRVFEQGMVKGQRRYGEHPAEHQCPHCGETMVRFRYRGYNLEIEACPADAGFWIDRGEDRHIQGVMRERAGDLRRSGSAERSWDRARRGGTRSFLDKVRDLFSR